MKVRGANRSRMARKALFDAMPNSHDRECSVGGLNTIQRSDNAEPYFLPVDPQAPDYGAHVAEVCHNLEESQQRIFLLAIRDRLSVNEIASIERTTLTAIRNRFQRMARKNPYVRIWKQYEHDLYRKSRSSR